MARGKRTRSKQYFLSIASIGSASRWLAQEGKRRRSPVVREKPLWFRSATLLAAPFLRSQLELSDNSPMSLPTELAFLSLFPSSDSDESEEEANAPPKLSSKEERIQRAIDQGKASYGWEQAETKFGVSEGWFLSEARERGLTLIGV